MSSLLEPALAFAEGLALIASPCILPVLPLVLSASVDGGKKRPFGIITGFVLAFSAFALASRKLVNALGIDPAIIQNASLVLLALFGLVLLSGKLSEKFSRLTQNAANVGGRLSHNNQGGYFSGVLIGALIGLIWTPCAGPILAAVLVQVIRQTSDLQSLVVIIPFAIGAGVPMLIIALMGRRIMSRLKFFTKNSETVRKIFGVIILASVAVIATGFNPQTYFSSTAPLTTTSMEATRLQNALPKPYPAPELTGLTGWLNSQPLQLSQLKGKVVLIDFWTYSCINCVRTLPYITAWDEKYRNNGLVIIGVHAPEFEFEKNADNVKAALLKHNIKYPVAQDNNLATWTAFQNQYWPAHYLIDKTGNVVYTHFGEGEYGVTENNIRYLLGLGATSETMPKEQTSGAQQTPETYLGTNRAERYAGSPDLGGAPTYTYPATLPADNWALQGNWRVEPQRIVSGPGASLRFNIKARKVFLVLGVPAGKSISATVTLNGKPAGGSAGADAPGGIVTVTGHTLYELADQKTAQPALLEITPSAPGLEAYAFTFGN